MLKALSYLFIFSAIFNAPIFADGSPSDSESGYQNIHKSTTFTGRVTRDKVRLRLQPTTDSPIIQEVNRGEMLLVKGEDNDFYAVKPITGTKAYIYRPLVLDGVVEGNKVNIRIEPHLEAPIIAQLNNGDRVLGKISEKNSKWLEIEPPGSTTFYISADFVEKIGDAGYLARFNQREKEVNELLKGTYLISQQELNKPFTEIEPNRVVKNYEKVIDQYTEFPKEVRQAKKQLAKFNDAYLHKKVKYLEEKTHQASKKWKRADHAYTAKIEKDHLHDHVSQSEGANEIYQQWVHNQAASEVNARMALWIPVEIAYYEQWAKQNSGRSIQDFYKEQQGTAFALRGIIEPYDRPVRNKPGDYLLVNKTNRLPIAYVYSTQVNLQDKIGHEVTLEAVLRPNNNFAYPAYFILSAD